jgi:hypothetical protein
MPSESSDLLDSEEVLICFRQITGGPRSSSGSGSEESKDNNEEDENGS